MPCSEVVAGELRSLTELVRLRAAESPDKHAFTFLLDGDEVGPRLTYGELAWDVGVLGAALRRSVPLKSICSMKWAIPACSSISWRAPLPNRKLMLAEWTWFIRLETIRSPLSSVVLR